MCKQGHSFAHQPVMFNPQVGQMQAPQAYYHPNGPQVRLFLGPRFTGHVETFCRV